MRCVHERRPTPPVESLDAGGAEGQARGAAPGQGGPNLGRLPAEGEHLHLRQLPGRRATELRVAVGPHVPHGPDPRLQVCVVGSLASAMAAAGRGREVILPLIVLPLTIPLIVGGVGASVAADGGKYLLFLAVYDLIFAILSWATFEYVVTE